MARPKSRAKALGPRKFARDPEMNPLPPAVRELLDGDPIDPELFTAVCNGFVRARFAGEDVSEPTVATWIVATARAEIEAQRASKPRGDDPFAA